MLNRQFLYVINVKNIEVIKRKEFKKKKKERKENKKTFFVKYSKKAAKDLFAKLLLIFGKSLLIEEDKILNLQIFGLQAK